MGGQMPWTGPIGSGLPARSVAHHEMAGGVLLCEPAETPVHLELETGVLFSSGGSAEPPVVVVVSPDPSLSSLCHFRSHPLLAAAVTNPATPFRWALVTSDIEAESPLLLSLDPPQGLLLNPSSVGCGEAVEGSGSGWEETLSMLTAAVRSLRRRPLPGATDQKVVFLVVAEVFDDVSRAPKLLAGLVKQLQQHPHAGSLRFVLFDSGPLSRERAGAQELMPDGSFMASGRTVARLIALGHPFNNGFQAHLLAKGHSVRLLSPATEAPSELLSYWLLDRPSTAAFEDEEVAKFSTLAEFLASHASPVPMFDAGRYASGESFMPELIERGEPVLIRNSSLDVAQWSCFSKWHGFLHLREALEGTVLVDVKVLDVGAATTWYEELRESSLEDASFLTSTLEPLSSLSQRPFSLQNMSSEAFFSSLAAEAVESPEHSYASYLRWIQLDRTRMYYFGPMLPQLVADASPVDQLFAHQKDRDAYAQYLWVSSKGVSTQLHFDSDHNAFVQVLGTKRWLLFPHHQAPNLYPFPKKHPRWHKSRVNMYSPPAQVLSEFPSLAQAVAHAQTVDLHPGDILFIPGFYWHFVESLSTSVSLSTWSHDRTVYDAMRAVYSFEHSFDLLVNREAKVAALRLFIDLLLHEIAGFGNIQSFVERFVRERFSFEDSPLGPPPSLCSPDLPLPIAQYIYEDLHLDATVIAEKFSLFPLGVQLTLLFDYLEDIATSALGVELMVPFFKQCFSSQTYKFIPPDAQKAFWAQL